MENLTETELKNALEAIQRNSKASKKKEKRRRRKLKFGKKALVSAFLICGVLIAFTMAMIYLGKDTTSLTILAAAGVGILPIMYGIYDHYSTQISLLHMEKNYIPNYDEEEGLR